MNQIIKLKYKSHIISPVGRKLLLVHTGNLLAIQHYFPACEGIHPSQNIQDRCFTCAGSSHDHTELSFFNLKVHIMQRFNFHFPCMIYLTHIFKFYKACHFRYSFLSSACGLLPSSQNATALAAATFRESTPWFMGMYTV